MATMTHPSPERGHDDGFSRERLFRAIFVKDTAPAEIVVGGFLMTMRGLTLLVDGFAYGTVADVLAQITVTADRLGALLLIIGVGQVCGTATERYKSRSIIALMGFITCLIGFLGYLGADLEHTGIARMWAVLAFTELALAWRVRFTEKVNGHDRR